MANAPADGRGAARPWTQKALWLIGIGLVANAAVMLYTHVTGGDITWDQKAFAQNAAAPQLLGARGIYMMPAQLGPQTYGLYLMDVDSETITVYRAMPESSRFHLMAARSFKYDRFLTDYNNDKLTPAEVQQMVQDQRRRQEIDKKTGEATVDQTPKPDENKPDAPK